jgi:hypothetical protein
MINLKEKESAVTSFVSFIQYRYLPLQILICTSTIHSFNNYRLKHLVLSNNNFV